MNRVARLIPLLLLPAISAQQDPEHCRLDLLFRVEGPPVATTGALLSQLMQLAPAKQALLEALRVNLPPGTAPTGLAAPEGWGLREMTPTSSIVELDVVFAAPKVTLPDAASEALAHALQQRIADFLVRPAAEEHARALDLARARCKDAERRCSEAEERLAAFGADDFATRQAMLADLQRQAPQVELDLRTEQAVGAQLHQQLDAAQAAAQKATAQLEQLEGAGAALRQAQSLEPALKAHEAQVRQGQVAYEAAQHTLAAVQEQATASSLALQRHQGRRAVLRELIDELQQQVQKGAGRARERAALEREYTAASATLTAARERCAEVQQRAAELPTVTVQAWR